MGQLAETNLIFPTTRVKLIKPIENHEIIIQNVTVTINWSLGWLGLRGFACKLSLLLSISESKDEKTKTE